MKRRLFYCIIALCLAGQVAGQERLNELKGSSRNPELSPSATKETGNQRLFDFACRQMPLMKHGELLVMHSWESDSKSGVNSIRRTFIYQDKNVSPRPLASIDSALASPKLSGASEELNRAWLFARLDSAFKSELKVAAEGDYHIVRGEKGDSISYQLACRGHISSDPNGIYECGIHHFTDQSYACFDIFPDEVTLVINGDKILVDKPEPLDLAPLDTLFSEMAHQTGVDGRKVKFGRRTSGRYILNIGKKNVPGSSTQGIRYQLRHATKEQFQRFYDAISRYTEMRQPVSTCILDDCILLHTADLHHLYVAQLGADGTLSFLHALSDDGIYLPEYWTEKETDTK